MLPSPPTLNVFDPSEQLDIFPALVPSLRTDPADFLVEHPQFDTYVEGPALLPGRGSGSSAEPLRLSRRSVMRYNQLAIVS